jgi:predicted O-methyltransferase YrrM
VVGIDLNPGERNRFVVTGDFNHIQFADASVDIVYSNVFDHAFDFGEMMDEIRRVLKPHGVLIAEIVRGSRDVGGREPSAWDSSWWESLEAPIAQIKAAGFELMSRRTFSAPWNGDQCVFALSSSSAGAEAKRTSPAAAPVPKTEAAQSMVYETFFQKFGGSARTKNIAGAEAASESPPKRSYGIPATSALPKEFIRLCPWEMEYLYSVARQSRRGILEIGRFNGGSTFLLACANQGVPIHSIDNAPKNDELLRTLLRENAVGNNVVLIVNDSKISKPIGPVDLIFIDGDHSYEGCAADLATWYAQLAEGGHLLLHDSYLGPHGVQRAIADFIERRPEIEIVVSPFIGAAYWHYPAGSIAHLRKRADPG